jgi:Zn-dependent protease with chaperone function
VGYNTDESEDLRGPIGRVGASLARFVGFEDDGPQLLLLVASLFVVPTVALLVAAGFAVGDEANTVIEMSFAGYIVGALIFAIIIGAPKLAGRDRGRMSLLFGPSARVIMLLLVGSILLQAALFVYSLFTLEASTIGRVHGGLMLVVGLGALYACYALVLSALAFFRVQPLTIRAVPSNNPLLRERLDDIASQLGSRSPNNIVLGLEPNFFITSAPVKLVGTGDEFRGTTLFLSLSLMRLLTDKEFDAVIGHELGHFRGSDTVYSLKFAPTYSRLTHALDVLSNGVGKASDLGRLPALAALSLYLTRFAMSERTVGRDRELLADQAGASVSDSKALATALLKVALFSRNWDWLTQQHISELGEGRTYTQLSATFSDVSRLSPDIDWDEVRSSVSAAVQSHPTDTHPTFSERLDALRTDPNTLHPDDCAAPDEPSSKLIVNAEQIDAQLSELEANWLLAIGAARLPEAA